MPVTRRVRGGGGFNPLPLDPKNFFLGGGEGGGWVFLL